MWQIDNADLLPWCSAIGYREHWTFARHDDWRLPENRTRERMHVISYIGFES
jgi:hypothetical protein